MREREEEDRGSLGDRGEGERGGEERMESLEYEMNLINTLLMK